MFLVNWGLTSFKKILIPCLVVGLISSCGSIPKHTAKNANLLWSEDPLELYIVPFLATATKSIHIRAPGIEQGSNLERSLQLACNSKVALSIVIPVNRPGSSAKCAVNYYTEEQLVLYEHPVYVIDNTKAIISGALIETPKTVRDELEYQYWLRRYSAYIRLNQ